MLRSADQINEVLRQNQLDGDILFVNDGSTDGTAEEIRQAQQKYPNVQCVTHPRNLGYGQALKTGYRYCIEHQYWFVFQMVCDLTIDAAFIVGLWKAMDACNLMAISKRFRAVL